jgi:hypothetical protein
MKGSATPHWRLLRENRRILQAQREGAPPTPPTPSVDVTATASEEPIVEEAMQVAHGVDGVDGGSTKVQVEYGHGWIFAVKNTTMWVEFEFLNIELTSDPTRLTSPQSDSYEQVFDKGEYVVTGNVLEHFEGEFASGPHWIDASECTLILHIHFVRCACG